MSSLPCVISALPLLVKFGTKEVKTNKTACTCTASSVHSPGTHLHMGFRQQTAAFWALGLNWDFEEQALAGDGSNETKSCLGTLITFSEALVFIFCLQLSQSHRSDIISAHSLPTTLDCSSAPRLRPTTQQGDERQKSSQAYSLCCLVHVFVFNERLLWQLHSPGPANIPASRGKSWFCPPELAIWR